MWLCWRPVVHVVMLTSGSARGTVVVKLTRGQWVKLTGGQGVKLTRGQGVKLTRGQGVKLTRVTSRDRSAICRAPSPSYTTITGLSRKKGLG